MNPILGLVLLIVFCGFLLMFVYDLLKMRYAAPRCDNAPVKKNEGYRCGCCSKPVKNEGYYCGGCSASVMLNDKRYVVEFCGKEFKLNQAKTDWEAIRNGKP